MMVMTKIKNTFNFTKKNSWGPFGHVIRRMVINDNIRDDG